MSAANARRLAWGLALLALALTVAATVISALGSGGVGVGRSAFIHVIATRMPGNAIGWLFLGVGVSASLSLWLRDSTAVRP